MNKNISIVIDSYVNADGVRIYLDWKPVLEEVHEERMNSLKAVERWIRDQIIEDLERRQRYAGNS